MTADYKNADPAQEEQQPDTTTVLATRQALWAQGYRPVPLYSRGQAMAVDGKLIHPDSRGKRPFGRNWGGEARRTPPAATIGPVDLRALNTGLLGDKLRIIDNDINDPNVVKLVLTAAILHLGETQCIRTRENSPRMAMLYRAAEGEPTKRSVTGEFGKVEILGRGQQLHAYGRHPSGAELKWTADPCTVPINTLPAVTEEQVTSFLTAIRTPFKTLVRPGLYDS